jgi:O-methyltransferase
VWNNEMAEPTVTSTESAEATIARLEAERDRLRERVQRLQDRERERRERVEQKRADRQEAVVVERPKIEFEPPVVPTQVIPFDPTARTQSITDPAELYLDLLKNCLTRLAFGERRPLDPFTGQPMEFDQQRRAAGLDWPSEAETMAGLLRLDNVQQCVVDVLRDRVPGDLVETGVWRGGITILMRAVLKAYGDTERTVWAADSFAGLPVPDAEKYAADAGWDFSKSAGYEVLASPVEQVQANFARYGLLDDQVRFLVGWFRDTLPDAPIDRIAVLRLDGDLYESTMDALDALYPKLSVGGYLIIDDYLSWEPCRRAVNDYRAAHDIAEPIQEIDWTGAFWQRTR